MMHTDNLTLFFAMVALCATQLRVARLAKNRSDWILLGLLVAFIVLMLTLLALEVK